MTFAILSCCQSKSPAPSVAASRGARRGRFLRLSGRALSASPAAFAFLLPKCPLCFAAWAAAFGAGAAWQRLLIYPWLRPALIALLLSPLLMQLAFAARYGVRRLRGRPEGCECAAYVDPGAA